MALLNKENYYEKVNDGNLLLVTRTEGSPTLLPCEIDDMTQCQLQKWVGKVGEMEQENNSGGKNAYQMGRSEIQDPWME